jgi:hypothetical protein
VLWPCRTHSRFTISCCSTNIPLDQALKAKPRFAPKAGATTVFWCIVRESGRTGNRWASPVPNRQVVGAFDLTKPANGNAGFEARLMTAKASAIRQSSRAITPRASPRGTCADPIAEHNRRFKSAVTNGRRLFVVRPGDTKWHRRFRDVYDQIIADLGGPDGLSEAQRQLARRAATIAITCEQLECKAAAGVEINLEQYGMLTDRLGRTFNRLGIKRQQRDLGVLDPLDYARRYDARTDSRDDSHAASLDEVAS